MFIEMTSTKKFEMNRKKRGKKKCYEFATMERASTINLEGMFARTAQQRSLCYNPNNRPEFSRKVTRLQLDSYSIPTSRHQENILKITFHGLAVSSFSKHFYNASSQGVGT